MWALDRTSRFEYFAFLRIGPMTKMKESEWIFQRICNGFVLEMLDFINESTCGSTSSKNKYFVD